MKKLIIIFFILYASALFLNCLPSSIWATPTSIFWTNCTTDTVETKRTRIDIDNYFTVLNKKGEHSFFPPLVGVAYGLYSWKNLTSEVGVDYLGGTNDPFYFNGKIGMAEGKLFSQAPSFSLGIFNIATRHQLSQNVVNFIVGKSLPEFIGGRLFFGVYSGANALEGTRQGVMVGFTRSFYKTKDTAGKEYDKWLFSADYSSGKNAIGGAGFAITYYFTPTINLETGPIWFSSKTINGQWKWSLQLGIDLG